MTRTRRPYPGALGAPAIRSFRDQGAADIFNGVDSKAARATCPAAIWRVTRRKLDRLDTAVTLTGLAVPRGNRLEPLKGERAGQHSIRINDQYRVCFRWADEGADDVEIVDYHRG